MSGDEVYHYSSGSDDDEPEEYVAHDSQPEDNDDGKDDPPVALGNVVSFQQRPFTTQPGFLDVNFANLETQAQDDRLLVLFDLNGVLVHHEVTFERKKGRIHHHALRPGVINLLRLAETCRLGIYTSATRRTVVLALTKLHENIQQELDSLEPEERAQFPVVVPTNLFDVVLCRDHCVLASSVGLARPDGKPWDTVKPLGRYFSDLSRVVLVDDSPHKSLPHETANMLVTPVWHGPFQPAGQHDTVLTLLVNEMMRISSTKLDSRMYLRSLERRLLQVAMQTQQKYPIVEVVEEANQPLIPPGFKNPAMHNSAAANNAANTTVQKQLPVSLNAAAPPANIYMRGLQAPAVLPPPPPRASIENKNDDGQQQQQQQQLASDELDLPPGFDNGANNTIGRNKRKLEVLNEDEEKQEDKRADDGFEEDGFKKEPKAKKKKQKALVEEALAREQTPGIEFLSTESPWKCSLCKVTCGTRDMLLTHARGVKHIKSLAAREKKVAKMKVAEGAQYLSDQPPWTCSLCGVEVGCLMTLESHARGSKHIKKAREAEAAAMPKAYTDNITPEAREKLELDRNQRRQQHEKTQKILDSLLKVATSSDEIWYKAIESLSERERGLIEESGIDLASFRLQACGNNVNNGGMMQQQLVDDNEGHYLRSHEKRDRLASQQQQRQETGAAGVATNNKTAGGHKSPLHEEILQFAERAAPTPEEIQDVQRVMQSINTIVRKLWPQACAMLFGSQATGLALPGADFDIVVLGAGIHLTRPGSGFTLKQRSLLAGQLEDLLDALLKAKVLQGRAEIIEARVPIIKCRLAVSSVPSGLSADISLGVANGTAAVAWVRRQVVAVPPLRPLCLVVKALLRDKGLNEVFTGGLGSYAVINMVLAHLQAAGYQPDLGEEESGKNEEQGKHGKEDEGRKRQRQLEHTSQALDTTGNSGGGDTIMNFELDIGVSSPTTADEDAGGIASTVAFLRGLKWLPTSQSTACLADSASGKNFQQQQQRQAREGDLGSLLWSFLQRFGIGEGFDYRNQAVSVREGGFIRKIRAWRNSKKPMAIAVEDPQEPGKDIGAGSYNIEEVRSVFAAAEEELAEYCEDVQTMIQDINQATDSGGGGGGSRPLTRSGSSHNINRGYSTGANSNTPATDILVSLLDVEGAVGRSKEAVKARERLERQNAGRQAARRTQASYLAGLSKSQKRKLQQREQQGEGNQGDGRFGKKARGRVQKGAAISVQLNFSTATGGVKGKGGVNKKSGTKRSRAVQAAWGNKSGQFFDMDDNDSGPTNLRSFGAPTGNKEAKKQKGIKRKSKRSSAGGSISRQSAAGADGGPSSKKASKKKKRKSSGVGAFDQSQGGSAKKKKKTAK